MRTRPANKLVTRGNNFSPSEQVQLRQAYPLALWPDLLALVPGRTRKQIISWADNQGIKRETSRAKLAQGASDPAPRAGKKTRDRPAKAPAVTPVLTARLAKATKKDGPTAIGRMLEQMRRLPGGHPRRVAYAQAARAGSGLDALAAWQNWPQEGGQYNA